MLKKYLLLDSLWQTTGPFHKNAWILIECYITYMYVLKKGYLELRTTKTYLKNWDLKDFYNLGLWERQNGSIWFKFRRVASIKSFIYISNCSRSSKSRLPWGFWSGLIGHAWRSQLMTWPISRIYIWWSTR